MADDRIRARLYDGTVMNFPAGTDPAVIQSTVKRETERRRTQTGGQNLMEDIGTGVSKVGTQLYKGVADVIGMPRALGDIQTGLAESIAGTPGVSVSPSPGFMPSFGDYKKAVSAIPSSEDVQQFMQNRMGIPFVEMDNKALAAGIRAIPGAGIGPGGPLVKAGTGFLSGAASELAGQATEGTPYETWARVGGALAGGVGGQKVGSALERVTGKAAMGPFGKVGLDPRLASQVRPDSTGMKWWQNATANIPGGFDRMQKAAQGAIDDVAGVVERSAAKSGTAITKQEAGMSLQKGGMNWLNQFELDETKKWNQFFTAMPSNTPVHLARTKAALNNVRQAMPDMPQTEKVLLGSKLDTLQQAVEADLAKFAQGGAVDSASLESVKNMRSIIGNIIKEPPLMNDMTRGKWAELYAALTEDIKESALRQGRRTGKFDALDKFNVANDFTREGHQFVGNTLSKILTKTGGITPEQAAGFAMSEARKGTTQIGALRSKLTPAEWEDFSSYVIRSLGRAGPGAQTAAGDAFSPATFLTNYSKLDPAARKLLFKGTGFDLTDDLDAVALIAEGLRDTAKLANSSRTAGTARLIELISVGGGALAGDAAGLVSGAALPYISGQAMSRLLTNKQFIKWLATPTSLEGLPSHLRRLAVVAQTSPGTASAIAEYLSVVGKELQPPAQPTPQEQRPSTSVLPQVVPGYNNVPP